MRLSLSRPLLVAGLSLWLGHATHAFGALGIISTSLSPASPVTVGTTVTVTVSISGYTDPGEIDGYDFLVTYPAALFNFVSGTFSHGTTAAGATQQWLAKANQDPGGDYSPSDIDDASVDGTVIVSLSDGAFNLPERGTVAGSGFLVSFNLLAEAAGSGSITPARTSVGAPVFFDTDLTPVTGAPTFTGSPITVVIPEPAVLALGVAGVLLIFRRRARRG